jgi:hypothetical protein
VQNGLVLKALLFNWTGSETAGDPIPTCPGCTSDNTTQTYQFEIPARTVAQGGTLPQYAMLTYLVATQPAGQGTDVLMAPSSAAHPDPGTGTDTTYREFTLTSTSTTATLTGRPLPTLPGLVCSDSGQDEGNGFVCFQNATRQPYLALQSITYTLLNGLDTTYKFSATPSLPTSGQIVGTLPPTTLLSTDEPFFP